MRRTNPISRGAGVGRGPKGLGPVAQNEPNSGGSAGGWNPHYSTIPSFHHSNPMPIVQNEPNFARPEGKCAEQTQFPPPGDGARGNCAEQSQTWREWGMWVNTVVGRGSAASETCETNPIWTGREARKLDSRPSGRERLGGARHRGRAFWQEAVDFSGVGGA
jgi:hypothetical protein